MKILKTFHVTLTVKQEREVIKALAPLNNPGGEPYFVVSQTSKSRHPITISFACVDKELGDAMGKLVAKAEVVK